MPAHWKILGMHHPPHTPRACACKLFGKCVGGHGDELALDQQLNDAFEGLEPPDIVMSAHNHIYARSHPLDGDGKLREGGPGRGVRYFVTGGGGAPLYGIHGGDDRWASALTMYHFVYMRLTATSAFFWTIDESGQVRDSGCFEKGSNVDHPLAPTSATATRCRRAAARRTSASHWSCVRRAKRQRLLHRVGTDPLRAHALIDAKRGAERAAFVVNDVPRGRRRAGCRPCARRSGAAPGSRPRARSAGRTGRDRPPGSRSEERHALLPGGDR